MNEGLTTLRRMARKHHQGGADADPIPAGPSEPEQPAEAAAATSGAAAPPPGPAAAPPPAETAPAGPAAAPAVRPPLAGGLREGHKVTFGEQARAVLGVTWRQARRNLSEMRKHPGGLIRHLFSVQGPSVDDQIEYKREKRYLPPGYDEDSIPALAGDVYQEVMGIPGAAVGQIWIGLVTRPLRAAIGFFPAYVITSALLIFFGEPVVGLGMLAGLAVAVIVALIGLEAWSSARRRAKQPPPDDDELLPDDWDDPGAGIGY